MKKHRAAGLSCILHQLVESSRPHPPPPLLVTNHRPVVVNHDASHPQGLSSFSTSLVGGTRHPKPSWENLISNPPGSQMSPPPFSHDIRESRRHGRSDDSTTIALFQEIINDQKVIKGQTTETGKGTQMPEADGEGPDTKIYGEIAELRLKLETSDWDHDEIIKTVLDKLIPRLRKSKIESVKVLRSLLMEPLKKLVKRKCRYVTVNPAANRIALVHAELDIPMAEHAPDLILSLIQRLIHTEPGCDLDTLSEHENALGLRESLLNDMLSTWRVFCYPRSLLSVARNATNPKTSRGKWPPKDFHFPLLPKRYKPPNHIVDDAETDRLLLQLFPNVLAPNARAKLRPAVIATYVLLSDSNCATKIAQKEGREFVRAVGRVLGSGKLRKTYLETHFKHYPDLYAYVLQRWQSMPFPALHDLATTDRITMDPGRAAAEHYTMSMHNLASETRPQHRALSRALEFKDIDEATKIWEIFKGTQAKAARTGSPSEALQSQYDYFVYVFMTLRDPNMAMSVWNFMATLNIKPSIKTWTAMLHGCKHMGKAAAIENVWAKLVISGTHPDMQAWTARISGLASRAAHREALVALDEMVSLWESPDRKPWAVKPTMAQVNAILSSLSTNNKIDESKKLIAWARQKNLEPDVYTFNVLISIALRHGNPGDASKVLTEMTESGVEPNEATITLVFSDLLNTDLQDTPQEQAEKVMGLLDQMELVGMKPNSEVYGKVIYLLLKRGSDGEAVVKTVLSRLLASGLARSPHIYAMLVDYYFSRIPADVEAVDNLITTRQLGIDRPFRADRAFWERVIKGYSECGGRIKDALSTWDELVNAPGSSSLEVPVNLGVAASLLRALVQEEDMQNAQRVVSTMEKWASRHRTTDALEHTRFWRHNFWHNAHKHGLLNGRAQNLGLFERGQLSGE